LDNPNGDYKKLGTAKIRTFVGLKKERGEKLTTF